VRVGQEVALFQQVEAVPAQGEIAEAEEGGGEADEEGFGDE
jgi:hypothetical protein